MSRLRILGGSIALALAFAQLGFAANGEAGKPGSEKTAKKEVKIEKQIVVRDGGAPTGYVYRSDDKGTRVWVIKEGDEGPGEMVFKGTGKGGYLGVDLITLTPELRTHFGAKSDTGVMVSKVEKGSPAEKAGLAVGDIITSFDGKAVNSSLDLTVAVRGKKKGDKVSLGVVRNGKSRKLTAVLGERDRQVVDVGKWVIQGPNGAALPPIEAGELAPVMGKMRELIVNPKGEKNLIFLKSEREEQLEKRLDELEKRLDTLQKELEHDRR